MPHGHEHRPGMAALAVEGHPVAARARDVLDDADRNIRRLEDRALLDVQLDEGMVIARRAAEQTRAARNNRLRPVSSSSERPSRSRSACAFATEMDPAMSRLPRQPEPNRVGSSAVNITTSSERLGLNPARLRAASASNAPSTPTTPS